MLKIALLPVLMLLVFQLSAQTADKIELNERNTPLNQVLLDLKENYGFQFAFDSDLLAKYQISANRTFSSQEAVIEYLLKDLPLIVEKSGDVFLILPENHVSIPDSQISISGQILASRSLEPLPYSNVLINQRPVRTDQQGLFNYTASVDSETDLNLQISHLGYYVYDTLLTNSINRNFYLTPQIERIKEIQVLSNPIEKSTLIGDEAGRMKINHQIAPILPGHGDNSVFTLLRLMPGILAAGEQSNDLLIWGSYESHSKIQFDGFTLFGLKNFNDNISVVNPLVVKNMEVMKGAYEARYGDRVGGIVDIAGKDGTLLKPTIEFNINSTTVNSMLQIPLSERSSLIAAYRQTYYQLYDPTQISFFTGKNNNSNSGNNGSGSQAFNFDVKPDYTFRDANLKYAYRNTNGARFALSIYGGGDKFGYAMESEISRFIIARTEEEKNQQFGGSVQYSHPWENSGDVTNFTLSYSAFQQQGFDQNATENSRTGVERITREANSDNAVDELKLVAEHTLNLNDGHKLLMSVGAIDNHVQLSRTLNEEVTFDMDNRMPRLTAYVQDEIPLNSTIELKTGIRVIYATDFKKVYLEPRVSTSIKFTENIKVNAAWGLFNQFTSKTTLIDSAYNFSTFWVNADNNDIPVLNASHYVLGLAYNYKGWTASAESYYKTTDGLNRYFNGNKQFERGFYTGDARSYGFDLFVKKEYKRHMAWISYSFGVAEEHFPFYVRNFYQPAPQQQKHELKFAGVVNFNSFYLSANYVYGSGFERFDIETEQGIKLDQPYNRLDAALVYKFRPGKVKAEAGISILNVLNTENIKYSNLRITSIEEISLVGVYADAISFTPALFLKIEL